MKIFTISRNVFAKIFTISRNVFANKNLHLIEKKIINEKYLYWSSFDVKQCRSNVVFSEDNLLWEVCSWLDDKREHSHKFNTDIFEQRCLMMMKDLDSEISLVPTKNCLAFLLHRYLLVQGLLLLWTIKCRLGKKNR